MSCAVESASPMFRRWRKSAGADQARLDVGEITIGIAGETEPLTVRVAGRVTVDSSPHLRSTLLDLLRRGTTPSVVIDMSAVSYLDMSGLATLLEALKAARDRSAKLRVTGINGEARTLVEIAQLDTIFRSWGSEVEFS